VFKFTFALVSHHIILFCIFIIPIKIECTQQLSWWCSSWASDLWSKGRWFDSRLGAIKSTTSTQPSIPLG